MMCTKTANWVISGHASTAACNFLHECRIDPQFIDGRQTSNRYSFRDLPDPKKGGGTPQPPQDRVETPNPPGGAAPPQPLSPNQTLTKKQMECPHKEVASPMEGVAYCCNCYLDMTDAPQEQEEAKQAPMGEHTGCLSSDG